MTIDDLIVRAKQATGPDAELDALITAWQNEAIVKPYPPSDDFGPHDHWQFWSLDGKHFLGSETKFKVHPVTASRDEAVKFFKSQFINTNDTKYGITMWEEENLFYARIWYRQRDDKDESGFAIGAVNSWEVKGNSLPLAIIIATLSGQIDLQLVV